MTARDPNIRLYVDLRNPAQFFACCGVLELTARLWPGSEGWYSKEKGRTHFNVLTPGNHHDPLGGIVRRLCEPRELVALADDHNAQVQADRKPVVILPFGLRLDWWLDSYGVGDRSELKVWAGQQTPKRNIESLRNAWREIRARRSDPASAPCLFMQYWPMTGRFGFDPSTSWEALDVGFSPDEQGIGVQTSPATEILAAIGLQRCRPAAAKKKRRWFTYRAWGEPLEIAVAPAAIVGGARALVAYEFPVVMRNAQYGSFGWAKPLEEKR